MFVNITNIFLSPFFLFLAYARARTRVRARVIYINVWYVFVFLLSCIVIKIVYFLLF